MNFRRESVQLSKSYQTKNILNFELQHEKGSDIFRMVFKVSEKVQSRDNRDLMDFEEGDGPSCRQPGSED